MDGKIKKTIILFILIASFIQLCYAQETSLQSTQTTTDTVAATAEIPADTSTTAATTDAPQEEVSVALEPKGVVTDTSDTTPSALWYVKYDILKVLVCSQ